jgi:hypothetical protein
MARRGSFGTFNAGSSNLSATIQALVRQQMAAEEQTLMNAFYNGTTFNGSVPTMQTIIEFYNRVADLSGIERGSSDWDALTQKVGAANNYDIKRDYAALINEFESSNGANYEELSSFLKGRAQESTDPQDSETYQNAMENINSSYIAYKGQALERGEITAVEYRSLTSNILDQMDPEDPKRYEVLTDSYAWEWKAEKTKWNNRLTAGTVNASQYAAWANGFKKSLIAAGIDEQNTTYTDVIASIAIAQNRGGGGGGGTPSPTTTRLNKTLADLNSVFSLAQATIGGVEVDVEDIMPDQKDVLKKLTKNPDLMGLYADWIDDNRSSIGPTLSALGITDGASFRQWVNDQISSGLSDAQAITASGGNADVDEWTDTAITNGVLTTFNQFAATSSKHGRDVSAANGDDSLIAFYDREYKNFLLGKKSYYGDRPSIDALYEQQFVVVQNELNAMDGKHKDGSLTVTGALNGGEPEWANIQPTIDNDAALQSGQAVKVWNKETKLFTTEAPRSAGASQGSYQYVSFTVLPDGTKVPSVISVTGKKAVDSDGTTPSGYIFELPNGKTYAVNTAGDAYEVTGAIPVSGADYVIDDFTKIGTPTETKKLPLIDTTPFIRQGANAGAFNPEDREARRAALTQYGVDATDLDAAAQLALQVAGALDPNARSQIENESAGLASKAVNIRAVALESSAANSDQLVEAAKLRNKPEAAQYETYVKPNLDKYEEVSKGLFRLKNPAGEMGADRNASSQNFYTRMGGQTGNQSVLDLPTTVDLRPDSVKSSARERDVTAAERIFTGYGVKSTATPSGTFFRNMPTTKQQYGVLPPALPVAAMPKPMATPSVPAPRTPDLIPPTAPKIPTPPNRQPVLPPLRGGGPRKL